jgi:dTDP-L-rhamnose 4-epimerase
MSVYGEGLYRDAAGAAVELASRARADLKRGMWEPLDASGQPLTAVPTPESKACSLESVYALAKYQQERLCLLVGRAYGISTVALRFFNVYGPRQALSNPYTGVLAIFASRLLHDRPPIVFEDGRQRRDFVSVHDVARAVAGALGLDEAASGSEPRALGGVLNVGSGRACSVLEALGELRRALGKEAVGAEITGEYRAGDVRHCFADIRAARAALGYTPRVSMAEGMAELASWLAGQLARDRTEEARAELAARGLTIAGVRKGAS